VLSTLERLSYDLAFGRHQITIHHNIAASVIMLTKRILLILLFTLGAPTYPQSPPSKRAENHVPKPHNECLGKPKYTGASAGYVTVENVCSNSISARLCTKYTRTGWSCQLYPAVLPHGNLKASWSETSGTVADLKAWATDYASGSHRDDYKNLPTVEEPNRTILPR